MATPPRRLRQQSSLGQAVQSPFQHALDAKVTANSANVFPAPPVGRQGEENATLESQLNAQSAANSANSFPHPVGRQGTEDKALELLLNQQSAANGVHPQPAAPVGRQQIQMPGGAPSTSNAMIAKLLGVGGPAQKGTGVTRGITASPLQSALLQKLRGK